MASDAHVSPKLSEKLGQQACNHSKKIQGHLQSAANLISVLPRFTVDALQTDFQASAAFNF